MCAPALAAAAPRVSTTSPAFWTGPYAGAQLGLNASSLNNVNNSSAVSYSIGPHIGYNLVLPLSGLPSPLILGADVFATFNGESDHLHHRANFGSHVYGMDALVGMPLGVQRRFMP